MKRLFALLLILALCAGCSPKQDASTPSVVPTSPSPAASLTTETAESPVANRAWAWDEAYTEDACGKSSPPEEGTPQNSHSLSVPLETETPQASSPQQKLSWPQDYLDFDWPEDGFEAELSELGFSGLDLDRAFVIETPIAYEDESTVIFWSDQGIFGLDLAEARVTFSLDFTKLFGQAGTSQGSHRTTVAVRRDGRRMVVGEWEQDHTGPMDDWYLVDLPTLTYQKEKVNAGMVAYGEEVGGKSLWTDEVFDEANAVGRISTDGRLGEAVYVQTSETDIRHVVPVFQEYMEFRAFP